MQCGQNVELLNDKLLVHHVTGRHYKVNRYGVGINALSSAQKFSFLVLEDMRRVKKSTLKNDYCHRYVCPSES